MLGRPRRLKLLDVLALIGLVFAVIFLVALLIVSVLVVVWLFFTK